MNDDKQVENPQTITIDNAKQEGSSAKQGKLIERLPHKQLSRWMKIFWIVVALLSAVWIFIPEPTDAIPVLGWLDEAAAAGILIFALSRLGIKLPFLENIILNRRKTK